MSLFCYQENIFWISFHSEPFPRKQKQKQVCTSHNWNCDHFWHLWPQCDKTCFAKKTEKKQRNKFGHIFEFVTVCDRHKCHKLVTHSVWLVQTCSCLCLEIQIRTTLIPRSRNRALGGVSWIWYVRGLPASTAWWERGMHPVRLPRGRSPQHLNVEFCEKRDGIRRDIYLWISDFGNRTRAARFVTQVSTTRQNCHQIRRNIYLWISDFGNRTRAARLATQVSTAKRNCHQIRRNSYLWISDFGNRTQDARFVTQVLTAGENCHQICTVCRTSIDR